MKHNFGTSNWREFLPIPVCAEHPEYEEIYWKAWELAFSHIKDIPGMPQNPYMDEAFCETQIWIWDTCFMSLFCKYAREVFPGVESLNNFYEVLYHGTHLPMVIPPENEPAWTGATPGVPYEIKLNTADNPPLFAWAEYENALMKGNLDYIRELLYERRVLQKHYEWIENLHEVTMPDGVREPTNLIAEKVGYRWEGGRSGMDNTPRGRIGEHAIGQRPKNPDMLWLDAICQQALSAHMIAKMYALVGDEANEAEWNEKYLEKKDMVNRLYWDETDQFYYDIDCNTHEFYKVMTIASYWTLTAEIASEDQAQALAKQLFNPETLGGMVPLVSLSRSDGDYQSDGGYWRGSVWLPTAYATLRGLANYGLYEEARKVSAKLLEHMYNTYKEYSPHTIWECYSPEAYRPATTEDENGKIVRPDFCGWSALGPISIYIEFMLGFHTVNAFERVVEWEKPDTFRGNVGIRNLRFGDIITDIVAEEDVCTVISNGSYTLKVNGTAYEIQEGMHEIQLRQ